MSSFFVYPLLLFALFRWKLKKTLHDRFAFNNNRPQIEHITKCKEKNINQSARGPQINQQRSPNIFGIFLYQKRIRLAKYQTNMGIRIIVKA
jgi:hypothetical protein